MTDLRKKAHSGWRSFRARPVLSTAFDVLILIAVMVAVHAWQTRGLPVAETAPARPLLTLDGDLAQSSVQPGAVGVVYFFAPWCHVCRASMGNLDELLEDGSVAWASAIALDYENAAAVEQFVDDVGITMPVLLGQGQEIRDWGIRGYPTYFVIDSTGRINSRSVGYSTALGLRFRIWWAD